MSKSFACAVLLIALAAFGPALQALLCRTVSPSSSSVVAAAFEETAPEVEVGPDLTISKHLAPDLVRDLDGDGRPDPGDTISYTVRYTNTGDVEAKGVRIVDDYNEDLIINISGIDPEQVRDSGKTITWDVRAVGVGETGWVTYEATLTDTFPSGSVEVKNTVAIEGDGLERDRDTSSVLVEGPAPILTIAWKEAPALVKDKDDDGVIDPGDAIRYILEYKNSGDAEATQVIIRDYYDQSLIVEVDKISHGGEKEGATITWELPRVGVKASGWVSYEATLKDAFPPGSIGVLDRATIESGQLPPIDVTKAVTVTVPNLSVGKKWEFVTDVDADGKIDPGDTIKYTIAYTNVGEVPATIVSIVDDYDQDRIHNVRNISGDGNCDKDYITWDLGTVEVKAGGSVSYEGTLSELSPGSHTVLNEATISSLGMQPVSKQKRIQVEVVPTPTPTPIPPILPGRPVSGVFREKPELVIKSIIVLAGAAMGILLYVGAWAKYGADDEDKCKSELTRQRIEMVRVGVLLIFIVSGIYVLAIGEAITGEAAISVLSAIVGYVFGRVTSRA